MADPLRTDTLHRYAWDIENALMAFRRASEECTTMDELDALRRRVRDLEKAVTGTADYIACRADRLHDYDNILSTKHV